jgi:multidrug efflux pump subunit AcrA (membrane-fusion protein)
MTRASAIITVSLAASVLSACQQAGERREPQARAAVVVTTARASLADVAERLEAGGVVAAQNSALVSSRIIAPILTVRVRAGDRVRTGDVLVTLDARDVADRTRQAGAAAVAAEKALAQAHTQQAAAQAEHRLAAAWQTRISALHARNSATAQERDEAEARLSGAAARLATARAAIDEADANVTAAQAAAGAATTTESFTVIRAPFDGLVTERLTDPGNMAAPGMPLLRLDSAGARHVEVTVDEARATFIHPGDRVDVVIERPEAGPGEVSTIRGSVTEVARAIAADRRAFTVKIVLPKAEGARTGTFARVQFRGASRPVLLIPATAVRRHGQIASVFVVEGSVARLRLVQTGVSRPEGIHVLAGLDAGELVVTSPPPQLVDGHPVVTSGSIDQRGARQ